MTVDWPVVVLGAPLAVVLWRLTSRTPPRLLDGVLASAVAVTCTSLVATRPAMQAAVAFPLAVAGGAAACVDAREGRLPDALTVTMLLVTVCGIALIGGDLAATLLAAAAGTAAAVALKLARDDIVGWGDVKLVPTIAAVLAHGGGSIVAFAGSAAVLVALTAWIHRTSEHDEVVPYGPALVVGALCSAGPGL